MARAAFASAALGWVVLVGLIVRHRVYVSDDSVSNYAHVWFIATKLRHAHQLPYAMSELGHGHGLAYPYAFLPWTTAALAWLVVGEWAVTLWLVVGAGLTVVATFAAFPEIGPKRRPILAAGVLVNPALLTSLWFGQLPFLWAVALLLFGVAAWRRRSVQSAAGRRRRPSGPTTAQARRSSASVIVLVALAQGTHPAIVAPMALALVIGWWHWEPDHRGLARTYAGSTLLALPAMWLVIASPVFDDASTNDKLVNFVETFAMRSLVVVVPILLLILGSATTRTGRWKSLATVAMASFALAQFARTYHHFPWRAPVRSVNPVLADFARSPAFVPGKTYRVLRAADGKIGMYQLLRAGARLDSEFFPESQARRSFPSARSYSAFLAERGVDFVLIFPSYQRRFATNEPDWARRCGRRKPAGPVVVYEVTGCWSSHNT